MSATFQFKGKTFTVSPIDDDRKAMFTRWLKLHALESIRALRPDLSAEEYHLQMSIWQAQCTAGAFAYGGPLAAQAALSPDGAKRLALLALAEHNPGVDEHFIDGLWNDLDAWKRFCAIAEALNP